MKMRRMMITWESYYLKTYLQSTGQMMSSVRLYFLPEYTLEGRQPHHGEVSTETQIHNDTITQKHKYTWQRTG